MSLTVNENEYGLTVSETPTHSLTVSGTSGPLTIASDDLTLTVSDTPTSLLTVTSSTDPSITVQDNNILLTIDQSTGSTSSANPFDQDLNTTDSPTFAAITVSGTVDGRDLSVDGTKLDGIAAQANKYVHPTYTSRSINTSGASVLDEFTSDVAGHVTNITTRTLTLADLGYTGAADANNYVLPTSFTARNINTSGAHVLDTFTSDTSGRVTGITTRPLLLADIGYTGATNADVTPSWVPSTNPNYLTAASTDLDSRYYTETELNSFLALKLSRAGGVMTGNITMSGSETVDGRDLSVDGAKLDGISAGADVTPSWVPSTNPNYLTAASTDLDSRYYTETETDQFLNLKANKLSPVFTGTPAAPTAAAGTNTTQLATTAFVGAAVAGLVDSAPTTLDTLNELAAALGDDANFSTTVTNSIATKLPLAGGQMTGNITMSGSETVDGRDLSVDGSKLDGISSGADVTPSWVPSTNPNYLTASSTDLDSRYYTETETNQFLALKAPLASPAFTGTPTAPTPSLSDNNTNIATTEYVKGQSYLTSVTASDVGLGNVTNESKATMFASPAFTGTPTAPTPSLSDNNTNIATTEYVKGQTIAYADLTGKPTIPSGNQIIDWTADQGSTDIHVNNLPTIPYSSISGTPAAAQIVDWTVDQGSTDIHVGNISEASVTQHQGELSITESQISDLGTYLTASSTDLDSRYYTETETNQFLALKAPLASPTFTGIPSAPTAGSTTNTTQLATTAFVQTRVGEIIDSAPAALDTLNELAAALGDDANFSTTVTNSIALKAPLASPTFTGTPTAPTPSLSDNNTNIATTEYVKGQDYLTAASTAVTSKLPLTGGTLTGDLILDDGSGHSPTLRFQDGSDIKFNLYSDGNSLSITREGNGGADFKLSAHATDYTNSSFTIGGAAVNPTKIGQWNTAYGWGNHASAGYLTASSTDLDSRYYTETETNQFLALKAPLASPAFTGTPTAPTPSLSDDNTNIATTEYVKGQSYLTASLNEGRLFVGNSSNQAVADGTVHVDIANSRVGIGTTNPTHKLDVRGDIVVKGGSTLHSVIRFRRSNSTTDFGYIGFENPSASNDEFLISSAGNGNPIKIQAGANDNIHFYGNTTAYGGFDGNGNLGIGTTSPSGNGSKATLHINSDSNGAAIRLSQGSNSSLIRYDDTNGLKVGTIASKNLSFETGDTTAVTIDTSQNVGIGTTGPDALLNVQGDSDPTILINAETGNSANSGKLAFAETDGGGHQAWMKYDGSANRLEIGTAEVSQAFVVNRTDGNVGIGTTTPSAKLEVNGHFAATTKSFIIDNPKTGGKLQYGVVESNQHSVLVRGKNNTDEIELPEEWEWLVDPDSVTVDLTSIGQIQQLFIISQDNKKIKIGGLAPNGQYNYTVYGERVDVDKLEVNV